MRRIRPILLVAAVLACATPAHAADSAVKQVYKVYQSTGRIDPCAFSSSVLNTALKQIGPQSNQYAPDFREAIKTALEQRAAGACDKKKKSSTSTTPATAAAPTSSGGSTTPSSSEPATQAGATAQPAVTTQAPGASQPSTLTPQPDPAVNPAPAVADDAIPAAASSPTGSGADDTPAPLLVLALMLGLLLVLGALWALARWLGFDPPWLSRWRHASQEAGWRASAAWSEFTDWVRLGR